MSSVRFPQHHKDLIEALRKDDSWKDVVLIRVKHKENKTEHTAMALCIEDENNVNILPFALLPDDSYADLASKYQPIIPPNPELKLMRYIPDRIANGPEPSETIKFRANQVGQYIYLTYKEGERFRISDIVREFSGVGFSRTHITQYMWYLVKWRKVRMVSTERHSYTYERITDD